MQNGKMLKFHTSSMTDAKVRYFHVSLSLSLSLSHTHTHTPVLVLTMVHTILHRDDGAYLNGNFNDGYITLCIIHVH